MGILDSPPQIFIYGSRLVFTIINQTSMGLDQYSLPQIVYIQAFVTVISPSQIFVYEHLFQLSHHHRSNIYGHFRFTTIDENLWTLISFHHHRLDIYESFRFTTIDFHLWSLISLLPPWIEHLQAFQIHHHRLCIYEHFRFTTIDCVSMGICYSYLTIMDFHL